jgi:hypothetical protein
MFDIDWGVWLSVRKHRMSIVGALLLPTILTGTYVLVCQVDLGSMIRFALGGAFIGFFAVFCTYDFDSDKFFGSDESEEKDKEEDSGPFGPALATGFFFSLFAVVFYFLAQMSPNPGDAFKMFLANWVAGTLLVLWLISRDPSLKKWKKGSDQ